MNQKNEQDRAKNKPQPEVDEEQLFHPQGDSRSHVHIATDRTDDGAVSWEASEFIHHQKSMGWYLILTVIVVALGTILYFALQDIWSIAVLVGMYLIIVVYAKREPRTLRYRVDSSGVTIGDKHYGYNQLRSFSVSAEESIPSVSFIPTQRFTPAISIYFSSDDTDRIITELLKFLTNEQKQMHAIDRAMLKLRF